MIALQLSQDGLSIVRCPKQMEGLRTCDGDPQAPFPGACRFSLVTDVRDSLQNTFLRVHRRPMKNCTILAFCNETDFCVWKIDETRADERTSKLRPADVANKDVATSERFHACDSISCGQNLCRQFKEEPASAPRQRQPKKLIMALPL